MFSFKRSGSDADLESSGDESTSKTARSDSEDPFYNPHCESDVTLVVEDKKLHVHKAVLSLSSPVFGTMFTADFTEKDAKEIPLPGKKYDAMLQFLQMMYPSYSQNCIANDDVLVNTLPLAEEYQVDHVRVKCENYIGDRLRDNGELFSEKSKLLYLLMCERYSLTKHFNQLLDVCSKYKLHILQGNSSFRSLQPSTRASVLERRCRFVENLYAQENSKRLRQQCTISSFSYGRSGYCRVCNEDCRKKPCFCEPCIDKLIRE